MSESITLRLSKTLRDALEKKAKQDGRSLSDYIRRYFMRTLNVRDFSKPPTPKVVPARKTKGGAR